MMPFWLCAVASGLLFSIGLVALARRPAPYRATGVSLMIQAALLLLAAAARALRHVEGQAMGLLLLGLLPALYLLCLTQLPSPRQPADGDEGGPA